MRRSGTNRSAGTRRRRPPGCGQVVHRDVAPAGHDVHELGQVGAAAEVRAVGPDDEDLDVVVDVGLADEVGVAVLGVDRHGVELVGTVERDGGDLRRRVLLVEDDLLRRWALVVSAMRSLSVGGCEARFDQPGEVEEPDLAGRGEGTSSSVMNTMRRGILKLEMWSRSAARRPSSVGSAPGAGTTAAATISPSSAWGSPATSDRVPPGARSARPRPRAGHVGGAGLDHVADASDEPEVAVGVDPDEVLGGVEAVRGEDLVAGRPCRSRSSARRHGAGAHRPRPAAPPRRSPGRRRAVRCRAPLGPSALLVVGQAPVDGLGAVGGEALRHAQQVCEERPGIRSPCSSRGAIQAADAVHVDAPRLGRGPELGQRCHTTT